MASVSVMPVRQPTVQSLFKFSARGPLWLLHDDRKAVASSGAPMRRKTRGYLVVSRLFSRGRLGDRLRQRRNPVAGGVATGLACLHAARTLNRPGEQQQFLG